MNFGNIDKTIQKYFKIIFKIDNLALFAVIIAALAAIASWRSAHIASEGIKLQHENAILQYRPILFIDHEQEVDVAGRVKYKGLRLLPESDSVRLQLFLKNTGISPAEQIKLIIKDVYLDKEDSEKIKLIDNDLQDNDSSVSIFPNQEIFMHTPKINIKDPNWLDKVHKEQMNLIVKLELIYLGLEYFQTRYQYQTNYTINISFPDKDPNIYFVTVTNIESLSPKGIKK